MINRLEELHELSNQRRYQQYLDTCCQWLEESLETLKVRLPQPLPIEDSLVPLRDYCPLAAFDYSQWKIQVLRYGVESKHII